MEFHVLVQFESKYDIANWNMSIKWAATTVHIVKILKTRNSDWSGLHILEYENILRKIKYF